MTTPNPKPCTCTIYCARAYEGTGMMIRPQQCFTPKKPTPQPATVPVVQAARPVSLLCPQCNGYDVVRDANGVYACLDCTARW